MTWPKPLLISVCLVSHCPKSKFIQGRNTLSGIGAATKDRLCWMCGLRRETVCVGVILKVGLQKKMNLQ